MNERDIAKYAALVATGVMTEDALLEALGDDSIVSRIMALAGTSALIGVAGEVVEDTVDGVFDILDDVNPFKW